MSDRERRPGCAAVFGLAGPRLSKDERALFRTSRPAGFILFARNVENPLQVRELVEDLVETVDGHLPLILVDQEGGRVARLKPPHWRAAPPARPFGLLAARDRAAALRATYLNARLLAADLTALGINVDCAPVLDLPVPGAHSIIGDRAFAGDPDTVAALGRAFCEGLLAGGVLPVVKHIPGHGRATVDSHLALPRVDETLETLRTADFAPFRALADQPIAMTAHIVYTAIDSALPATLSARVIGDAIRGEIGFDGLLLTDDIGMQALVGEMDARSAAALAAGCDLVLHCSGALGEMRAVAAACGTLTEPAVTRLQRALQRIAGTPAMADTAALAVELDSLLAG